MPKSSDRQLVMIDVLDASGATHAGLHTAVTVQEEKNNELKVILQRNQGKQIKKRTCQL